MTPNEVREKYLKFFEARGHTIIPSASLVPENDPTTLFTGSGMQPLVPYLLGKNHPAGTRLVDSQKCFRAMDIEEVGDNRHTTFFEMLGNWSFGDYFKKEQLQWFYEFLVSEVRLPTERLWVTCFEGDPTLNLPKDTESFEIWKSLGIPEERIKFYPAKKNWWSRAGEPQNMPAGEPGGPDSEVFYEFTHIEHDPKFGAQCHPNCDCGRFMEIGNSVFMQYIKNADGSFGLLPKQNVDFGGGLERIAAASINSPDVFMTEAFAPLITKIEAASGKKYADDPRPFRIITDHVRAAEELIAHGVLPGNVERGYVVRRLLRRAVRFADTLGLKSLTTISNVPEIQKEEEQFRRTLNAAQAVIARRMPPMVINGVIQTTQAIPLHIFELITTYGYPREMVEEEMKERKYETDWNKVEELLNDHRKLSRAGSEQKFKGGLADTSEKTTRLHTAHHLLLKALQQVLGPHVHQRGSNITQERLRIDFSHPTKMTKEQLAEVEKIVNEKIKEDLPVIRTEMSLEEAEKLHAEHEFGAKYPERVSVYSVGPLNQAFSIEFCGGPHVTHTGELASGSDPEGSSRDVFKIQKEEAVAQGIRRIKAVLT